MYEESLVFLKERLEERQDQAGLIVTEMRQLKENFERKKKKLEDTASTKRDFAFILLFVPVVNLIAFPLLEASAESDLKEANANGAQAAIQEAAVTKLSNTLIPALQAFVNAIAEASGFFSVMEEKLSKFEERSEMAKKTLRNGREEGENHKKRLHYLMMKNKARDIKSKCQNFSAVLPIVRNDLSALTGTPHLAIQWF